MRRITQQRHAPINPAWHRVAVDHRVFKHLAGATDQGGHIQPIVIPALEMVDEPRDIHLAVPVALPAGGIVYRLLGDPVDCGQPIGIGGGNGVNHHPVFMRAQPHKGRACANGRGPRHAAPQNGAAPLNGRLIWIHLRPQGRMQPIGPHQQAAGFFMHLPRRIAQLQGNARLGLRITHGTQAGLHRIRPKPLLHKLI